MLTRRALTACLAASMTAAAGAQETLASIERRGGGRLGVYAVDTGSARILSHRADERFLMCSTFKGILAALVLSRVDAGRDDAASLVRYGKGDLLGHSPVTKAHVGQGALPLEELCKAIVLYSDNGAANLLLRRVGGPVAFNAYLRVLGDPVTRLDRYEPKLNDRSGVLDTTTPRAMAGTVRRLILGDGLTAKSRVLLEGWMIACETGTARLRAGFPGGWTIGDKTGTGDGLCNDYAIARRPGRAPLIMAAYYDAPGMKTSEQEAVIRQAGSVIARWADADS